MCKWNKIFILLPRAEGGDAHALQRNRAARNLSRNVCAALEKARHSLRQIFFRLIKVLSAAKVYKSSSLPGALHIPCGTRCFSREPEKPWP